MSAWPTLTIEQCCKRVTSGGTPRRSSPDFYRNGTIPWVKTGELKDRIINPAAIGEWITEEAVKNSSAKILPANTVLMAMYGDGRTIGSLGLVRSPVSCNQACCAMIPNPDICDAQFLFYAVRHYRNAWIKIAHGGAQRNLSGAIIRERKISVPALSLQKRIASILGAHDDLIEVNRRRIAVLEEMARRLFEEWFVRFRFPGNEGHSVVEMADGLLPEGWKVQPFTDVADVLSGGTPRKDRPQFWGGDIPFFTPRDAPLNAWALQTDAAITEEGLNSCNSRLYEKGTIFITARGTVGKIALAGRSMAMNQSCYALRGRGLPQFFLLELTRSAIHQLRTMSNGAVFDTIIVDTFRKLRVVVPPVELAKQYDSQIRPSLELSRILLIANERLATSRDMLLPRLISGELSVASAERELEAVA